MLVNGTSYHDETPKDVINLLERLRTDTNRKIVRINYGDVKTGQLWGDVETGFIGRSMGNPNHPNSMQVPLSIPSGCSGGGHIMDNCILLIEASTRGKNQTRTTLYIHPKLVESGSTNYCPDCGQLRTCTKQCKCEKERHKQGIKEGLPVPVK